MGEYRWKKLSNLKNKTNKCCYEFQPVILFLTSRHNADKQISQKEKKKYADPPAAIRRANETIIKQTRPDTDPPSL